MKIYYIAFIAILFTMCNKENNYPAAIKEIKFEDIYDNIKWELYKSSLYCKGWTDYNILTKKSGITIDNLMQYPMHLDTVIFENDDNISLIHFFKIEDEAISVSSGRGLGKNFYHKLTFIPQSKSLFAYSSGGATFSVYDLPLDSLVGISDEEFINELRNRDKIDEWLKSEIKRRGYTLQ